MYKPTNKPTNQPTSQPTNQPTDKHTHHHTYDVCSFRHRSLIEWIQPLPMPLMKQNRDENTHAYRKCQNLNRSRAVKLPHVPERLQICAEIPSHVQLWIQPCRRDVVRQHAARGGVVALDAANLTNKQTHKNTQTNKDTQTHKHTNLHFTNKQTHKPSLHFTSLHFTSMRPPASLRSRRATFLQHKQAKKLFGCEVKFCLFGWLVGLLFVWLVVCLTNKQTNEQTSKQRSKQ